jgi:hypothetical protein
MAVPEIINLQAVTIIRYIKQDPDPVSGVHSSAINKYRWACISCPNFAKDLPVPCRSLVQAHPCGDDARHLCSRSQYPAWCPGLAALLYPADSRFLVYSTIRGPCGLCGNNSLSCFRIRIFSPGDTDHGRPVYTNRFFHCFYRYICCTLDGTQATGKPAAG